MPPVALLNAGSQVATLALSTANVALLLRGNALRIGGKLGNLTFTDDSNAQPKNAHLKNILSIEGSEFAEFNYETYDPVETETFPGYNSLIVLHAGAIKINFLEQPIHELWTFVMKLATLKGLYDAAATAAVQRASEVQRMKFDISVKSPIIVFPKDPTQTEDALILKLGEVIAKNEYEGNTSKTQATLRGIRFSSHTYPGGQVEKLKMIDDVEITANVIQTYNIDRKSQLHLPDTQVCLRTFSSYLDADFATVGFHILERHQVGPHAKSILRSYRSHASFPTHHRNRRGAQRQSSSGFGTTANEAHEKRSVYTDSWRSQCRRRRRSNSLVGSRARPFPATCVTAGVNLHNLRS